MRIVLMFIVLESSIRTHFCPLSLIKKIGFFLSKKLLTFVSGSKVNRPSYLDLAEKYLSSPVRRFSYRGVYALTHFPVSHYEVDFRYPRKIVLPSPHLCQVSLSDSKYYP